MSTPADVATGYLDAFVRGHPDEIAAFVSDGFLNEHLSSIASSCVGRDEYRRRLPGFLSDFGPCKYDVLNVVEQVKESHTDVAVRYDFIAVHDGISIAIPGVMWFTIVDGRIAKRVDVWDSGTFFAQKEAGGAS